MSHAQFANDTILLGGASAIITKRFNKILQDFTLALEEQINVDKSRIYGWNTLDKKMQKIIDILGFKWEKY